MSQPFFKEQADIGACMDVKAHNGRVYAIQRSSQFLGGRLCVLSDDLALIGEFRGIGNARQIEIIGDVAVITARENGLWLFDISLTEPRLLCHYQTVEYATGVALYGNLALVSCRQYGIQILDISDPTAPVHISIVRIGEIQSATVSDGILYGGAWGEMKVVAVDIHDPAKPKVLSEVQLQGRGDGVCVRDGILYAATGQHARGIKNTVDHDDPMFGMGNGVESFDMRDPTNPIRLSAAHFEKGYFVSIDMWEAAIYGDTLIVNNPSAGVYGLEPTTLEIKWRIALPESNSSDGITGVTALNGDLLVATAKGGLFRYAGLGLAQGTPNPTCEISAIVQDFYAKTLCGDGELSVKYSGTFPVLMLAEAETYIAAACGEGGIHLLDKKDLHCLAVIPTEDIAQDVKIHEDRLYVADGNAGVKIFKLNATEAIEIGRYRTVGPMCQISVSKSGRYLMCSCGGNAVRMLDVSDPDRITELYSCAMKKGPLYGNNFASEALDDGTMLLFCHRDGLIFSAPDNGDTAFHVIEYIPEKGFCSYCAGEGIETDGKRIFYTYGGGLVPLSLTHTDPTAIDTLPRFSAEKKFTGLLTMRGDRLVCAKRYSGEITVLDISDIEHPRILTHLQTNASPGKAIFSDERILLPGGRSGLLEVRI